MDNLGSPVSLPLGAGGREGNGGAGQGAACSPAGGENLPLATNFGVAQVPTGVGRQGHGGQRQPNTGLLVAVLIDGGYQQGIGFAHNHWHVGGNAGLGPEVQPLETAVGVGSIDSGYLPQRLGYHIRVSRRAVVQAGVLALRSGGTFRDPPVQVDQGCPEKGPVVPGS